MDRLTSLTAASKLASLRAALWFPFARPSSHDCTLLRGTHATYADSRVHLVLTNS